MFKHILVPLDGSITAECVLPHAIAFAHIFKARVTILRVLTLPTVGTPVDVVNWQLGKVKAEEYLNLVAERLQTAGVPTETLMFTGQPINIIVDYIRDQYIDLVIMSSHGESGVMDLNMGSIVQNILLRSRVSGLLVRANQPFLTEQRKSHYQHLLVPLDGSLRATHVLPFAASLARVCDSQLLLVHVLTNPEMPHDLSLSQAREQLSDQLTVYNQAVIASHFEYLRSQLPDMTEFRLMEHAEVASGLHAVVESEKIDLVIMSAHGYSGGSQWPYGSVTTNLMAYGTTPLLFIQDWTLSDIEDAENENKSQRQLVSGRMPSVRPENHESRKDNNGYINR